MKNNRQAELSTLETQAVGLSAARLDMIYVFVLVVVSALLLMDFGGTTIRSLAARHADATVDFYQRHQFFDVRYNHELYQGKLPFPFWLMSGPLFLLGVNDAALRLTSELFGIGLVLMVFLLGRKMFNPMAGFFAGLAAAANLLHPWVVKHSLPDTSALFLMSLSVVFFYLGWRNERRRTLYVFLFYAASAVATWHRGPLGFVLPGIAVAAVLLPLGQWRVLGQFLNPLAILMWLALVVPYYAAMNPGHLTNILFGENLAHFVQGETESSGGFEAVRPPHFWPVMFLFRYLPWTGFFLLSLVYAFKQRTAPERSELWFVTAWFGSWFLFWDLSAARNETYLLVMLVPTALFIGYVLEAIWRDANTVTDSMAKRLWLIFSFLIAVLSSAAMPIVMLLSAHVKSSMALWGCITGALAAIGLIAVVFAASGSYRRALVATLALAVIAMAVVGLAVKPIEDRTKPGKRLFEQVRGLADDHPIVVYGHRGCSQLAHEDHAIVLYLRSRHPVTFADGPDDVRKVREASPEAVIFAPDGAIDELALLKLGTKHVTLWDDSGIYILYFAHPDQAPARVLVPVEPTPQSK